jgi:hypothetical protein
MDAQAFSYQGTYYPKGNFIPHYLEQSQIHFTGLPFEVQEPSPAPITEPSPVECREQRRRRSFDRLVEDRFLLYRLH